MAGAQTSLSLQDKLTGPLTKMMKALDNTIKVMEKMDQSATNLDTRGLANARRSIDNASADLARLSSAASSAGNSADRAADQQRNFNDSISGGLPSISKLVTGLLSAAGAYKVLSAAKSFIKDVFSQGIEFNTFKQASESAFTIFLGDAETAKKYMDDMYAFALKTPFAYPDLLESSRNLIAFGVEAENTFAIMQAIGDTVAMDVNPNVSMANMADIFGMIQVSGRITTMEVKRLAKHGVNAYEMIGEAAGVTAEEMKSRISKGAVGAGFAITALVEGMEKSSGGLMEKVKGTLIGSVDSLKSSIRSSGATMMDAYTKAGGPLVTLVGNVTKLVKKIPEYIGPAVAVFLPVINQLNAAFEAGRFDVFFATMSATLITIAYLFAAVAEGAIWVAEVVDMFWPAIVIALVLLATSYIPKVISVLGIMALKLYDVGRAWLVGLGPVGWVILAVSILIGIVMHFGVTTEQILGFVGGLFFALGAVIWNQVANLWNIFAMFAEFLVNLFFDPTYAMKKLIYDMANHAVDNMAAMAGSFDKAADILGKTFVAGANIAIGGINGLIKALNKIPGVDIGEVAKLSAGSGSVLSNSLKKMANNLEVPTSDKNVKSIARMKLKSIPGAYQSGYSKGSGLSMPKIDPPAVGEPPNMNLGDMFDELAGGKDGKLKGGKLDKVGKIDDEISIADEDLKMLRDLAEIKSVQNFVTLTPQVNFGDLTIREEVDADKVVKKITTQFAEDMARSAEGVYT